MGAVTGFFMPSACRSSYQALEALIALGLALDLKAELVAGLDQIMKFVCERLNLRALSGLSLDYSLDGLFVGTCDHADVCLQQLGQGLALVCCMLMDSVHDLH